MFKLEFPSLSSFTCVHNHVYLSPLLEELEQLSIVPSLPENLVHCFSPPVLFLPPLLIINTTCFLTIPVTMLIPYRHNQQWDVKSFFFYLSSCRAVLSGLGNVRNRCGDSGRWPYNWKHFGRTKIFTSVERYTAR